MNTLEKILIVDDNSINRKLLCNILKDCYDIEEADNGETALEILKSEGDHILAVLLDIIMPGMDGFEVLKQIRNNPQMASLPVIIQTENTESSFETNALKQGATDFVAKPYNAEVIRTRLQNVINTRIMLNEISALGADELTGLMSVNQFYMEGSRWIGENQDCDFDVVALDIVRFGIINDSKGMEGGNEILTTIADAIKHIQEDVLFLASRVYADRFVLLLKRREGYINRLIEEADSITRKYADKISVHMKFGIYEITEDEIRLPIFCSRAFSATNLIKDFYGNKYAYYDEKLHAQILHEEKINDEMEKALSSNQFVVYFQPKFDLFTGSIAGAEALVRWQHPEDGLISPGVFIPIFEKNGFIVKLDQFVWDTTARKIEEWINAGDKVVPVSVNISRIDIETIDVVQALNDIVNQYHISTELLHLEITESAYMQDTDKIIEVVSRLKEKGFIIEMDDFGSGYSSLNMLAKLPINILKLDMKFIQDIENSTNAKTIIEYTIGLAKWMNLPVVAEGVETDDQLALLRTLECNYVQGYIFAKPLPEEQFRVLLLSHSKSDTEDNPDSELFIRNAGLEQSMLIVEDMELNRAIIRSYFEESFNIIEAVHGKAAFDYLKAGHKIDIIVLDLFMPEMNGYEFLRHIKQEKELKKIPILAISSQTNAEEDGRALKLGADAFVSKPFTPENVINRVRILLRGNNVLENLNIWDLKDIVDNPWLKEICDEIIIVNTETEKICRIEGNQLPDTEKVYTEEMTEKSYTYCMTHTELNRRIVMIHRDKEQTVYAKKVHFEGIVYLFVFKL